MGGGEVAADKKENKRVRVSEAPDGFVWAVVMVVMVMVIVLMVVSCSGHWTSGA